MRRLAVLLIATVAVAAVAHLAAAKEEVVLVQLTHRHGARTPIVPGQPSTPGFKAAEWHLCGQLGCGMLTHPGKMMLESLGNFLHDRYGTNTASPASLSGAAAVPASADFAAALADGQYHMRRLRTRSTQVLRTMQSADAVIRGVVQNLAAVYPVVHTVDYYADTLLHTVNALSMEIPMAVGQDACLNAVPAAWAAQQGVTPDELRAVAAELRFPADYGGLRCAALAADSPLADWMDCARPLWGAVACLAAAGRGAEVPTGLKHLAAMGAFTRKQRECAYVNVTKEQGAISFQLVDQMVQNMVLRVQETLQGKAAAPLEFPPSYSSASATETLPLPSESEKNHTPLVYHYSAHDTTVAPLAVALGHPDLLLPGFGQTIITELVFDASKLVAGGEPLKDAFTVRHWYGAPNTTLPPPAGAAASKPSDYPYVFAPLSVRCMDDIGTVFNASSCSLYTFINYVESQLRPASPAGAACYLSKDLLGKFNCSDDGPLPEGGDWRATGSLCARYRAMCPAFACKTPGYIVSQDPSMNLSCVPTTHHFDVSLPALNGIMFGTAIGGAVIGAIIAYARHMIDDACNKE